VSAAAAAASTIGRDEVSARLDDFLAPTTSGAPNVLVLEGEAGIGKTGTRVDPGDPLPLPARLNDVVAERLEGLSAPGEAALVTAALAQPAEPVVRAAVGGGADAIADAVAAGVLRRDRSLQHFAHPLVATALYEVASPEERRRVHRTLAALVENPEERARQLAEAADGPDGEVGAALDVAARSVTSRGAHDASSCPSSPYRVFIAGYARFMRASMLEVLNADYIRTARAKGMAERHVILRHAFRMH
jgi:hypothetical protein